MKHKSEIGRINGEKYNLVYDKRGNQVACDYEYRNEWRWFLWINGDYEGDFRTKKEAFKHVRLL
ncbi:MAG TPA: hypothetical protein ENH82_06505 [bacterium]|nr:hypothetical protein [bacterium]